MPECLWWSITSSLPTLIRGRMAPTPEELLDQTESELYAADYDEELAGMDRRQFMFLSLVAAAATAFGADTRSRPGRSGSDRGGGRAAAVSGQQAPPVALGNGEPPALQFQPYPGGTGALMEKLRKGARPRGVRSRGRSRSSKWKRRRSTRIPTTIAFLPAHRLSALIKAKKITSLQLTEIYLARLKRLNPTLLCAVTIMEDSGAGRRPCRRTRRSRPANIAARCTASPTA